MFMKRRLSKFTAILLAMALAMTAAAPAMAREADEESVYFGQTEVQAEKQEYPYIRDYGGEDTVTGSVNLYFIDGGDIPYVSLSEFMALYSEFQEQANEAGAIEYQVSQMEDHQYRVTRADRDGCTLWIDTLRNTLVFEDFNAFVSPVGVTASVGILDLPEPGGMDFFELMEIAQTLPEDEQAAFYEEQLNAEHEPESLLVTAFDTINRAGDMVVLTLSDYLIDLVEQDGECYLPLQTLNDLLVSQTYFNLIFNGTALYCFPYQSKLLDQVYQTEPRQMSQEFALFNYNELRLMLDCNYGLKPEHNISDFGTLLAMNTDLVQKLTSTDPNEFDDALSRVLMTYFDDGHSAFLRGSWMATQEPNYISYLGLNTDIKTNVGEMYRSARAAAFPDGVPMYQEIDDTAFITFDAFVAAEHAEYYHMGEIDPGEFVISTESAYHAAMEDSDDQGDALSAQTDTIKLLYYAYQQITRDGGPIKNVVIDLSNNGGGMANAAVYTLAWLLGRADVAIRDTFTGAETIMRIAADLQFDESYTSASECMLALGYNVYCLTTSNSFSCGNLVPAACKMSEQVTLIGKPSGGGSCVVLPGISASGTVFQISGPRQLSTIRNGSFYNIDQGIEPDVVLTKPESFYDREGLVEMIHNLK